MNQIKRNTYLNRLIDRRENGLIKIITGIRRCGKSYLLDPIYKNYLIDNGVEEDHIIKIDLDERRNSKYLNIKVSVKPSRIRLKARSSYSPQSLPAS